MTDFFADLERELDAAHAREGNRSLWERFRGAALPALRPGVAAIAAAAAVVVAIVWAGTSDVAERDMTAVRDQNPAGAVCERPPRISEDQAPDEILQRMSIFRDGEPRGDAGLFTRAPRATVIYARSRRTVEMPETALRLVAARVVPQPIDAADCDERDARAEPGACLSARVGGRTRTDCWTLTYIGGANAVLDLGQAEPGAQYLVAGLATDGAGRIVFGRPESTTALPVERNVFLGEAPLDWSEEPRRLAPPGPLEYGEGVDEQPDCDEVTLSSTRAPQALVDRVGVFGRAGNVDRATVARYAGVAGGTVHLRSAQDVEAGGRRYLLVPMSDCGGRPMVCIVTVQPRETTSCAPIPETPEEAVVVTAAESEGRGRWTVAAVVTDGVPNVRVRGTDPRAETLQTLRSEDNFASATVAGPPGTEVSVEVGGPAYGE